MRTKFCLFKKHMGLVCGVVVILGVSWPMMATAKTVIVDPTATEVPGEQYTTIMDAINNYIFTVTDGYHRWGDSQNDTILMTDGPHVVGAYGYTQTWAPYGGYPNTFTIKPATGAHPVLTLDPDTQPQEMFNLRWSGTYILEGLTMIGAKDLISGGGQSNNRSCINADGDDPGIHTNVIIRDCVITKNNGADGPVLDFTQPPPDGTLMGTFDRGYYTGDAGFNGDLDVLFENCVIAYTQATNGALLIERPIGDPAATRDITFRNVLFVSNLNRNLLMMSGGPETHLTFEGCCFANYNQEGFLFLNDISGPFITFTDCIFNSQPAGSDFCIRLHDSREEGEKVAFWDLTVDRCTFAHGNSDMILMGGLGGTPSPDKVVLRDIIDVDGNSSLLSSLDDTSYPTTLTVQEGIASDLAAGAAEPAQLQSPFAALYGGTGPITPVPATDFIKTDFDNTVFANIRKWDSTTNSFYDIAETAAAKYQGKGSSGSDLTGGAECPSCGGTGVADWFLY